MLEYIILGYLFTAPMTESTLRFNITLQIKSFYQVTQGSIYPALRRMVTKQYIVLRPIEEGSKKKQYFITDKGRVQFNKWMAEPINLACDLTSQLLKVFFAGNLDPVERQKMLTEFEANAMIDLKRFELLSEEDYDAPIAGSIEYYQRATLYFGILSLRGSLKWCQSLKAGLHLNELL